MSFIQTQELKVAYGDNVIINNEKVAIDRGEITAIIGPNGCGKSTMLKAIARVIPYEGQVFIKDEDINIYSRKSLAKILSMLPQKPEGTIGLTVEELVAYGRHPYSKRFGGHSKEDLEKIKWAMKVTGISEFAKRQIDALSGGQKQRV